jgi:hypothetical protein
LIEALAGCLEPPCLVFVLSSMVWGHLSLSFDSHIQSLTSSILIYAQSWQHIGIPYQARLCQGTPFLLEFICEYKYGTSPPNVSSNI